MVELITVRNGKIVDFIPFYWDTVQLAQGAGGLEAARSPKPSSWEGATGSNRID
jgi:hypothetical protein